MHELRLEPVRRVVLVAAGREMGSEFFMSRAPVLIMAG
jgi:hypothetical protein